MSETKSTMQIEFIKLDGHAVRVTSWRPGAQPGTFNLVTITRGSRDVELLDELLGRSRLELDTGSGDTVTVTARDIDRRTIGEGQSGITRFSVVLAEENGVKQVSVEAPVQPLEDRVAALEAEIDRLRNLILRHAHGVQH